MRRILRSPVSAALLIALCTTAPSTEVQSAPERARVWAADDSVRIRRQDINSSFSYGDKNPIWRPGSAIQLSALRDETIAFQIVIEPQGQDLSDITVEITDWELPDRQSYFTTGSKPVFSVERFVEHYTYISQRSRNEHFPIESLGWTAAARPPDESMLGLMPDALIPIDHAAPWCPYPLQIPAHSTGSIWIDITIRSDTPAGLYHGLARVRSSSYGELSAIPITLNIGSAQLPYRAVSFLVFYDPRELTNRMSDAAPTAERQLWQLLHSHHIDALGSLTSEADATRLHQALDGSLFTAAQGYDGPGSGVPPAAVALGAYGTLGDPTDTSLARVERLVPLIPQNIEDVILYAADEKCKNRRGPQWRQRIGNSNSLHRVHVAQSCSDDPNTQDVDLILIPANDFCTQEARKARHNGHSVWVYNGALPHTGTLLLDTAVTGLRADGWIAASHNVGRWFLWESTFWDDSNRGGHGPIDPFTIAESFHNSGGDSALGDGILVYPGTQLGQFASHSLGFSGVVPSIRLKNLRRGIQDAGYVALARAHHTVEVDALIDRVLPTVLDETKEDAPPTWSPENASFAAARETLRSLIANDALLSRREVSLVLQQAADRREQSHTSLCPKRSWSYRVSWKRWALWGVALFVTILLGIWGQRRYARFKT